MLKFIRANVLTSVVLLGLCQAQQSQHVEKPIWSKNAISLDLSCANPPTQIASPDHRSSVEIVCNLQKKQYPTYSIRIAAGDGKSYTAPLDEGAHELLWSPDSKAFFIDGATSAYAGFFLIVYRVNPSTGIHKNVITRMAQRNMVISFPPCKAYNRDASICGRIAVDPQYNMSGIAWTHDSSAIDVFAEVPCSSSYGGIMCQVLGYELSVPDGRILRRFTARQVQSRWQKLMAWKMNVPDAPVYGPAQSPR